MGKGVRVKVRVAIGVRVGVRVRRTGRSGEKKKKSEENTTKGQMFLFDSK